jgi:hypothetical protein
MEKTMEYKYSVGQFTFSSSVLTVPPWITLNIGKTFEIIAFNDEDTPGYIFFVLVLPEKIDPNDGAVFMKLFYGRFSKDPFYSIPKTELELDKLPELVRFGIRPSENPRENTYVSSCDIIMRIEGTSYYGTAELREDDLFTFDLKSYLQNSTDQLQYLKEETIYKEIEKLGYLDQEMYCSHKDDE